MPSTLISRTCLIFFFPPHPSFALAGTFQPVPSRPSERAAATNCFFINFSLDCNSCLRDQGTRMNPTGSLIRLCYGMENAGCSAGEKRQIFNRRREQLPANGFAVQKSADYLKLRK